ncbi:hypothetical protein PG993_013676 [Apiospora rasikravindrae]|uniref:Uncharacterized protein n=1 Tax=Apiospora rasikravindrae TaxID=990691 RepID=A0ABR1RQW6_9PEZI
MASKRAASYSPGASTPPKRIKPEPSLEEASVQSMCEQLELGVVKVELADAHKKIQELSDTAANLTQQKDEIVTAYRDLVAALEDDVKSKQGRSERLEEVVGRYQELVHAMEQDLIEERGEKDRLEKANAVANDNIRHLVKRYEEAKTECEEQKHKSRDALILVDELASGLKAQRNAAKDLFYPQQGPNTSSELPGYLNDPEVKEKIVVHYHDRVDQTLEAIREKLKEE